MSHLSRSQQEQVISLLLEGASVRSAERLTGIHRDTIIRLMQRVGRHAFLRMDQEIRGVEAEIVQCDEVWTYVAKKDKRLNPQERLDENIGSQFVFVGMDAETKLVLNFEVGKRNLVTAQAFMHDLRRRIKGKPTIITDGFEPYIEAVACSFGSGVNYAMLVKTFSGGGAPIREGYAPAGAIVTCEPRVITGHVHERRISTSLIERQNCTLRNYVKRLARLTLAFSKRIESLVAALALHYCWYNFGRFHGALRCTPAMEAGIALAPWRVADLLPGT